MKTFIDRVVAAAGHYEGVGDGSESGPFTAVLDVRPLLDGMGAEIAYAATGPDGDVIHREHTVLAFDMWSGQATLHVLCAEISGLGRLVEMSDTTFSNGAGIDGFDLGIELVIDNDSIVYTWSWGAPGEATAERSRAEVTLA